MSEITPARMARMLLICSEEGAANDTFNAAITGAISSGFGSKDAVEFALRVCIERLTFEEAGQREVDALKMPVAGS